MKRFLPKSEFRRNVLTLMTGTTIAQALPIAVAPILTRIYTPDDFGVFALYMAVASIISVIATGRYELAIMLPHKDSDAANIVVLSILIALLTSLLVLVVVFLFNSPIARLLGNPQIGAWLYLIPVSVLITGIFQTMSYWNNRKKAFKRLSLSRILQSGGTASSQIIFGYSSGGLCGGLIVGSICGQCISISALIMNNWKEDLVLIQKINKIRIVANARKFKKFPKMSALGGLLDTASIQMPIFVITRIFGTAVTGMFGMTFKVLNMPMALISRSISQVLFQKVVTLNNKQPELLFNFILKIFFILLVIAIPFVAMFTLFGTELFTFVFGQKWAMAGNFATTLSVAVAVRFVVSPLSSVLDLNLNVERGVRWQIIYFFTITITLIAASGLEINKFLLVFVIHEVLLYGLYLYIILVSSREIATANK